MLSSNEQIDLMITGSSRSYASQTANGSLVGMNDLIDEYCPAVKEAIPEDLLEYTKVNGISYGVPTVRDWGYNLSYMVRKDIYDKYDLGSYEVNTYNDLTPIFKVITEGEGIPATVSYSASATVVESMTNAMFDTMLNGYGVLEYGHGTEVVNMYATDAFKAAVELVHEWYEAGYIPADLSTQSSTPQNLIASGYTAGMLYTWKPGHDTKESYQIGVDVVSIIVSPFITTTSTVDSIMWSIPTTTVDATKAAQMLNLMYGNKELMDLWVYGIEGEHYVYLDEENDIITYPEGVDSNSTTYSPQTGWLYGNQFLGHIFYPDTATLWEETASWNANRQVTSLCAGFIPDLTDVATELAAVTNVKSQYMSALGNGEVDPDEYLPILIEELEAAGIDKIIATKQEQLDAWIAENGTAEQNPDYADYSSASVIKID